MFTLVLLILPALLVLIVASKTVRTGVENQTAQQLSVWATVLSKQLTEEFGGLSRYVESFALRPSFVEAARHGNEYAVQVQLESLLQYNGKITRAVFTDKNGTLIGGAPEDERMLGRNFAHRDWFRGASGAELAYVSEVYHRSAFQKERVVTVACAVRSPSGETLGYLATQYLLQDLNDWIDRIVQKTPFAVVIQDRNGNAVRDRKGILGSLRAELAVTNDSEKEAGGSKVTIQGEGHLSAALAVQALGWNVFVLAPESVAGAATWQVQKVVLLYFVLFLILLLSVGAIWIMTLFRYANGLERSNKHLEYFCYSIAHNFRAPLRAIVGFSELLHDGRTEESNSEREGYLTRIANAAIQMDDLIGDLLEFGRISHTDLRITHIEIKPVIEAAIAEVSAYIHERGAEVQLVGSFNAVLADPPLLQRVFRELICNGVKFVPSGRKPIVLIETKAFGTSVRAYVRDNGPGIEASHREGIFEIFHKLEVTSPGTGVGLAIVRNAIEQMGGEVGVESSDSAGSSFWIELPRG